MDINNNDFDEIEQLNLEIDSMLSSEDALGAALESENPLIHLAARLATDSPPILSDAARGRIQQQVNAAKILSPNYFAWTSGLVAIAAIIAVAAFGVLFNNPEQDSSVIVLTQSEPQVEETQDSFVDIMSEDDSSPDVDTSDETSESVETVEIIETELPELTAESESAENTISVQSNPSETLFINPGGSVNVRSGPDASFAVITTLTPNTEVTVLGTDGDWTQVVLPDGQEGWVASFLLGDEKGSDGRVVSPGGDGRDTDECERGKSCDAPGQTGENPGNGNGRGQSNGQGKD